MRRLTIWVVLGVSLGSCTGEKTTPSPKDRELRSALLSAKQSEELAVAATENFDVRECVFGMRGKFVTSMRLYEDHKELTSRPARTLSEAEAISAQVKGLFEYYKTDLSVFGGMIKRHCPKAVEWIEASAVQKYGINDTRCTDAMRKYYTFLIDPAGKGGTAKSRNQSMHSVCHPKLLGIEPSVSASEKGGTLENKEAVNGSATQNTIDVADLRDFEIHRAGDGTCFAVAVQTREETIHYSLPVSKFGVVMRLENAGSVHKDPTVHLRTYWPAGDYDNQLHGSVFKSAKGKSWGSLIEATEGQDHDTLDVRLSAEEYVESDLRGTLSWEMVGGEEIHLMRSPGALNAILRCEGKSAVIDYDRGDGSNESGYTQAD
ncbi:hypothetical protein WJS89_09220 [Sphingomicrobium sp. XHP0235]|uniref:hypothetical protein n=1 Tax=Sphingomicrobium aquimarinum TaxID=3133971 RepID=UPI0031FE7771